MKKRILCLAVAVLALAAPGLSQELPGARKPTEAIAPASARIRQLRPLMRNGKPFFPIGAYGTPIGVPLGDLRKQGWNTVLVQGAGADGVEASRKAVSDLRKAGLTAIVGLGGPIAENKEAEMVKVVEAVKGDPAVLGYYLFDEPENHYSEEAKGQDLDAFIRRKIGWAHLAVRAAETNPEHYTFGCIAWWTDYRGLQPICDVNMPNEYPSGGTKAEFEGDWPNVVYDAKRAAEAAQANGGLGFVYTPMAADVMGGIEYWRSPTVREFRYSAFAPLTQGAMGVILWAAYRCTKPYAERVVFPVTRELSALTPFFLGEWMDSRLTWQSSGTRTKLLKEYGLTPVSACLRRAADGRYLLLAVNNTLEPVKASLRVSLTHLPPTATDSLTGSKVAIKDGTITDTIPAYGVRAFILPAGAR